MQTYPMWFGLITFMPRMKPKTGTVRRASKINKFNWCLETLNEYGKTCPKNIFIVCLLFYIHEFCQTKDQRKQQHVQAANCLGKFFGTLPPRSPGPPLQTMCAHLSAKTPASLDLQISPEIEESAGREILKQSGASFFPSPDLTCPIWRFFSRLSNLFLQIFCVP